MSFRKPVILNTNMQIQDKDGIIMADLSRYEQGYELGMFLVDMINNGNMMDRLQPGDVINQASGRKLIVETISDDVIDPDVTIEVAKNGHSPENNGLIDALVTQVIEPVREDHKQREKKKGKERKQ